jgi:pyruvate/2-oxoacid:ferredoxin oxidoreductase alpha subunit
MADGLLCCYGGMTPVCLEAIQRLRDEEGLNIDLAVFTQWSPTPGTHVEWLLARCRPRVCFYAEESSTMAGWSAEMVACGGTEISPAGAAADTP